MDHYCTERGWVVGERWWFPTNPFDYSWPGGPVAGCNHLRCSSCGQQVTRSGTTYACQCASHDESDRQLLNPDYLGYPGSSALDHPAPVGAWACAGHPALTVPAVLDGIRISSDNFREIARAGFASPPFVPPESSSRAVWVSRLYWILPDALRPALSLAVVELLLDDEPWVIRGALDFLSYQPRAAGHEQLTPFAREHRARLAKIVDPFRADLTLEDIVLFTLSSRAFRRDDAGNLVDAEANAILRETLLSGTNVEVADDVIYTFARLEPEWFAANAVVIAKNAPSLVGTIVFLLSGKTLDEALLATLRAIADLSASTRAEFQEAVEERFGAEDRARILAGLSP